MLTLKKLTSTKLHLFGTDIDKDVVEIAKQNVASANLSMGIYNSDFRIFKQPILSSFIVCNPPYGVRVQLPDMYKLNRSLGHLFQHTRKPSKAAIISTYSGIPVQSNMKLEKTLATTNGGLEVGINVYNISPQLSDLV